MTSILLPMDANCEKPTLRRCIAVQIAMPSAPLWDTKPTGPESGTPGANVAFSDTRGSALNTPRQFGPTTRIP